MKYNLGRDVKFVASSEVGTIVGRSEHIDADPQYMVRYMDATGCQRREWVAEADIEPR